MSYLRNLCLILGFMDFVFGVISNKSLPNPRTQTFSPTYSSVSYFLYMVKALDKVFFFFEWRSMEGNLWIFNCSAAAAAKSLQSCPTLCDPVDGRRIPRDRDSPGKNTGVGCHFSFVKNHLTMFVFIYLWILILLYWSICPSWHFLIIYCRFIMSWSQIM